MEIKNPVHFENLRQKNSILNKILEIFKKSKDHSYLEIIRYHLSLYIKYLELLKEKGPEVFPNRLVYQKFQVAKFVIDKISLLEFSVDPSLKGFKEYKDMRSPPMDAFSMTCDIKEAKKIKFCQNVDKGDILLLKVVEEYETEYKLLVINKYNENERVADYFIYAYMMKSYQLEKLPRPFRISDFVRAAVLGKLKMEENVFSKLLVTLNFNLVNEKYKDVSLGLVSKSEISCYLEDISNFNSFLNYMEANECYDDPQDTIKCMTSLGIDPYKIYSFHEDHDGRKLGKPKEIYGSKEMAMKAKKSKESMNIVNEVIKHLIQGAVHKSDLPLLEKALELYPNNDAAYAARGKLYKQLFLSEKNSDYLLKALKDLDKSLVINAYNAIAVREYFTILLLSIELYKEGGDNTKVEEIMATISNYKNLYNMTQLLPQPDDLEEGEI